MDIALRREDLHRLRRVLQGFIPLARERERLGEVRMRQRAGKDEVDLVGELDGVQAGRLCLRQPMLLREQRSFCEPHEDEVDDIVRAGRGPRFIQPLSRIAEAALIEEVDREHGREGGVVVAFAPFPEDVEAFAE